MSWTEEKVEKLKELWGKDNTASQIAEIIGGMSRNAVIGKAHRLNLSAKMKARSSSKNKKLHINLAINYGSKEEIINAVRILNRYKKKITEKNINENLYTKKIPNPDILIRTGNTNRLSNFLLWQLSYTEIFFEKKLWPDFKKKDYKKILNQFKISKRNFGGI